MKKKNKFLNKSIRGKESQRNSEWLSQPTEIALEVYQEFQACWESLAEARTKLERMEMYVHGNQWGDLVVDPDTGRYTTEEDLIKKQGKVPLKNNMISPIVKNIDGQFRNNLSSTIASVRDSDEQIIGDMMSIAIEYVHQINELDELDANNLKLLLLGGFIAQRVEYGVNPAKGNNMDCWVYGCNPSRLFFNTNIEDVRGWDIDHIGEVYDMSYRNLIAAFPECVELIKKEYGEGNVARLHSLYASYDGLQGNGNIDMTFSNPSRPDLCRIIYGWRQESRESYFCHDMASGTFYYVGKKEKSNIDQENNKRIEEGLQLGVSEEDVLLIETTPSVELYWQYYYLTYRGTILKTGRSPYWHKEHNYIFHAYPMIQGKVYSYIEDFIDQQRAINRTLTLIDFIRGASSKGVLVVDEDSFDGMSRDDIIDEYVRYNGVMFCTLKNGKSIDNVVKQYNSGANVAGDFELLNLQLKLINEISGVNSAMQGRPASSGVASSLYAQQVQNSSMNLKGLFDSFTAFRKRRDYKMMQTIQQYYNAKRHLDLGGRYFSDAAKYYDPEKVQDAMIDIKLTDSTNTAGYQFMANDFIMQLLDKQVIDAVTALENTTFPFKDKMIESLKTRKAESEKAQQQQQMVSQEDMLAMQAQAQNPQLLGAMNNDALASQADGVVMSK